MFYLSPRRAAHSLRSRLHAAGRNPRAARSGRQKFLTPGGVPPPNPLPLSTTVFSLIYLFSPLIGCYRPLYIDGMSKRRPKAGAF